MEFDRAYHEKGKGQRQGQKVDAEILGIQAGLIKEENGCSYHDRSRGNGEAIEALGVYGPRLNVKSCQTKSPTSNEEERADPSDTTVRGQGPDIDKNSRRHAEGDYIGKRVKLQAKPRGRLGKTGNFAVNSIKETRGQDECSGQDELALYCRDNGVEAEEYAAKRQKRRKDEDALLHFINLEPLFARSFGKPFPVLHESAASEERFFSTRSCRHVFRFKPLFSGTVHGNGPKVILYMKNSGHETDFCHLQ